jgi:hypothetical protein
MFYFDIPNGLHTLFQEKGNPNNKFEFNIFNNLWIYEVKSKTLVYFLNIVTTNNF